MTEGKKRKCDLGRDGTITFYVSEDEKRLLIKFDVDKKGLTKAGVNGFIDALKDIREKWCGNEDRFGQRCAAF